MNKFRGYTLLPMLVSCMATHSYFCSFYSVGTKELGLLCLMSFLVAFFITLGKRSFVGAIVFIFAPFIIIFNLTHNFLFGVLIFILGVAFLLFQPKKQHYSKILFTDNCDVINIKCVRKKTFGELYSNCALFVSILSLILFSATCLITTKTLVWGVTMFPQDIREKAVFEGEATVHGTITSTAWYDAEAMYVDNFYTIDTPSGEALSPCEEAGMKKGDIITHINGERALSSSVINGNMAPVNINITLKRFSDEGKLETVNLFVIPKFSVSENKYRLGIQYYTSPSVSASIQTLSFSYPDTGYFAATAHSSEAVYDNVDELKGILLSSTANGRSEDGISVTPDTVVGEIAFSNDFGSFGRLFAPEGDTMPIAKKHQVRIGSAKLLSAFSGEKVLEYEIFITGFYRIDSRDVICFTVTDERIISSGGVTFGMSGSPIIQNGRIIGALSNMDEGGISAYATYAYDMAHQIYLNYDKLSKGGN